MKKIIFRFTTQNQNYLLFISFLFLTVISAKAQSRITGKITDRVTNEALVGVTVAVKGTTIGTSTDLDGKYTLTLKPGTYDLIFRYIQYKTIEISGIKISEKEVLQKDIILEELSFNGKELTEATISAQAKKESVAGINLERKNAATVSDGISNEQIKKTPDRNVSDALKRISGTSIQENKFAIIRGMNDRYNAAYLNGAPLPSTESDRKAFSFNIIPSALIDNIMIYKAPSPDITADFAGGLIMINTKNLPESKISVFNFSFGSHSLTTFKEFSSFRNSKTDILGFDNGTRSLKETRNYRDGLSKSEYVDFTRKLNNDWKIYNSTAMPNLSMAYTWGKSFLHHKNSFGTIFSVNYSNNNRYSAIAQNKYRYEDNNTDQNFIDKQYLNNVSFGALLNLGYKLKKKHIISLKNLFNINTDDVTTLRTGLGSGENQVFIKSYSNIYNQNRIFSSQLSGEHSISDKEHKVMWVLNAGEIFRSVPDYRIATYSGEGSNTDEYSLAVNNNMFSTSSGRFYSDMNERIISGNLSYSIPFEIKKVKNVFKTGVLSFYRFRDFKSRYFTYYGSWGISGSPENNLSENNINENGVYLVEQSSPARDNYTAEAFNNAAYAMFDTKILKSLRIVYGVRYEKYHQKVNTANGTNLPLVIDSTYINLLPSLNLTWNYKEKTNFRISAGKSLNRPEFRELSAFPFYNYNLNSNIAGNPSLQPATVWNYDLRWEYFPTNKEIISAGMFYKKINNPIEMSIDVTQVSLRTFGYANQHSASNFGFEFDLRKNLDFIGKMVGISILKDFVFNANITLIKSAITFNKLSPAVENRPLQGQSPYIINTGLQYNDTKSGWGANISYNKTGRRIAFVGAPKLAMWGLDIYENSRTVIDFQISKSFKKWDYKLTAGDLLGKDIVFYQDNNKDKKYNVNSDNTIFNIKAGRTVSAGISYKFN